MWTVAVDSDALVRFLNRNALTLEKLAAALDAEDLDEDLCLELCSKAHQSLVGMASYLKMRKANENDQLEAMEAPPRDREVASGYRQDLAGGDHSRGPKLEATIGQLQREALKAATHRNRGRPSRPRRRTRRFSRR